MSANETIPKPVREALCRIHETLADPGREVQDLTRSCAWAEGHLAAILEIYPPAK